MSNSNSQRRRRKKHPLPPLVASEADQVLVNMIVYSWKQCPHFEGWGNRIDCVHVAYWEGTLIAWPGHQGECFSIFRIADSAPIEKEELPSFDAAKLDWFSYYFHPALALGDYDGELKFTMPTAAMAAAAAQAMAQARHEALAWLAANPEPGDQMTQARSERAARVHLENLCALQQARRPS